MSRLMYKDKIAENHLRRISDQQHSLLDTKKTIFFFEDLRYFYAYSTNFITTWHNSLYLTLRTSGSVAVQSLEDVSKEQETQYCIPK